MIQIIVQGALLTLLVPLATLAIGTFCKELDMIEQMKKGTYRLKNNDHS